MESYQRWNHTIPYQYNTTPWYGHTIHTNTIPYHGMAIPFIPIQYHTMVWPYHTTPFIPYHSNMIPYHLYQTIYTIPFIPYHSNHHTIQRLPYHSHITQIDNHIVWCCFDEEKCKKQKKSQWWEESFTSYLHNGSTLEHNSNRFRKLQCRATTFIFLLFLDIGHVTTV